MQGGLSTFSKVIHRRQYFNVPDDSGNLIERKHKVATPTEMKGCGAGVYVWGK